MGGARSCSPCCPVGMSGQQIHHGLTLCSRSVFLVGMLGWERGGRLKMILVVSTRVIESLYRVAKPEKAKTQQPSRYILYNAKAW